ncbi:MAG: 4Fe-4S binding protein [Desulfovibrionaceae bacterium]
MIALSSPPHAYDIDGDTVEHSLCQGCGLCSMVCPSHALSLNGLDTSTHYYQKIPTFNADLCIHCGRCSAVCPSGTMHQTRFAALLHHVRAAQPRVMVFICCNVQTRMPSNTGTAPSLLTHAQILPHGTTLALPDSILLEQVRCIGRVGARLLDSLVQAGVQRIVLISGPLHLCHYQVGLQIIDAQCTGLNSIYQAYGVDARIHIKRWIPENIQELKDYITSFVEA